ncbi:MAG: hypothetical protein KAU62_13335 [Candidatus Heimdallarchaeota archaeon]|nr:hypothetical protein [Candidatus Heimdallarchaeota archaeon]MCG3257075.1 hypothetical protein [Candidatus Heimdallarchaeota archaeon]MCK4612135.1 hypothetical protein [Candidatus Heimdallarchaeota archaeon]
MNELVIGQQKQKRNYIQMMVSTAILIILGVILTIIGISKHNESLYVGSGTLAGLSIMFFILILLDINETSSKK